MTRNTVRDFLEGVRRRARIRQFSRLRLESERRMKGRFERMAARQILVSLDQRSSESGGGI